jgi:hypothetical protein
MRRRCTHLLRLLSLAAIISGVTATQAAAIERIRFSFNTPSDLRDWVELAGTWSGLNGKYVGKPGRDPEAISFYNDLSGGTLSTFQGNIIMTVPKDGTAFVVVRGGTRLLAGGKRETTGYFLGMLNRLNHTHLRVFVRSEDGAEKILCNKLIEPRFPNGFQNLDIIVSGSTIIARTADVECRGFDRSFGEGRFGLVTRGGAPGKVFRVDQVEVLARD